MSTPFAGVAFARGSGAHAEPARSAAERLLLIFDDERARALRLSLQRAGFAVCGEAATSAVGVTTALELRPDIVLVALQSFEMAVRTTKRITSELPRTAVVVLARSDARDDLLSVLRAGAAGYLLRADPRSVVSALHAVLAGEVALPRSLVGVVVDEVRHRHDRRLAPRPGSTRLSEREGQVLDLLLEGMTTRQIATRLYVSSATVRSHVSAIVKKLDVADREELVRLFKPS